MPLPDVQLAITLLENDSHDNGKQVISFWGSWKLMSAGTHLWCLVTLYILFTITIFFLLLLQVNVDYKNSYNANLSKKQTQEPTFYVKTP